jgi:hypothetical protein
MTHLMLLVSGSEKAAVPWKVSDEGLVDATLLRAEEAKSLVKSQRKSKLRLRSTPGEELEDAGLRFLRQQLGVCQSLLFLGGA